MRATGCERCIAPTEPCCVVLEQEIIPTTVQNARGVFLHQFAKFTHAPVMVLALVRAAACSWPSQQLELLLYQSSASRFSRNIHVFVVLRAVQPSTNINACGIGILTFVETVNLPPCLRPRTTSSASPTNGPRSALLPPTSAVRESRPAISGPDLGKS